MAYWAAKRIHGTEPTGSPVKINSELPEESTSKIQDLAANYTAAAEVLKTVAHNYMDDAEKVFENGDFSPLFQQLTLDKVCMTTPRWKRFLALFWIMRHLSIRNYYPPLDLIKHSMQQELTKQTTNFSIGLVAILLECDNSPGKQFESEIMIKEN